jgi:hypothetical protein
MRHSHCELHLVQKIHPDSIIIAIDMFIENISLGFVRRHGPEIKEFKKKIEHFWLIMSSCCVLQGVAKAEADPVRGRVSKKGRFPNYESLVQSEHSESDGT